MNNRFALPHLGFGLGLRAPHYETVLHDRPAVDWFEIITENFVEAHDGYWDFLAELAETYPLVLHGVSLSIGGVDPINTDYLQKLKQLAHFVDTPWISDHLSWTSMSGTHLHDLLPIPYTEEALSHIAGRIRQVQDILERPLILENPSSYVSFKESSMPEWEFLSRLAEDADCGILLDVNNVYVSAFNHQFDPQRYINALPADRIVQIHLAGHEHCGTHIIDTHDRPVIDDVWKLYAYTLSRMGLKTTMVEWDGNIPEFGVLLEELHKARDVAAATEEYAHVSAPLRTVA